MVMIIDQVLHQPVYSGKATVIGVVFSLSMNKSILFNKRTSAVLLVKMELLMICRNTVNDSRIRFCKIGSSVNGHDYVDRFHGMYIQYVHANIKQFHQVTYVAYLHTDVGAERSFGSKNCFTTCEILVGVVPSWFIKVVKGLVKA